MNKLELMNERATIEARLPLIQVERQSHQKEISALDRERDLLKARIAKIDVILDRDDKPVEPRVSDHAILRYLERHFGIDIEALRAKITTPSLISAVKMGASALKVDGGEFRIKDGVVVTYIGKD